MILGLTLRVCPIREESMQEAECRCLSACNISRFSLSGRDVCAAIGYSHLYSKYVCIYCLAGNRTVTLAGTYI